ncbi:golgin candidate 2 isoform X2 [Ananas comosus]|uniref:Golgin candidate 2 isoform X2 n=1 Tax=Ananas comosus TaxID=4615 RepID=A0A6P5EHA0_ANACO|nr:golgin candidate 2 isoform X2 [Ananas comosus]
MAGWISSKLKVAETFLQQIDQQAAETLRKTDGPRSPSDPSDRSSLGGGGEEDIPKRIDPAPPLRRQLPKKLSSPPPLPSPSPSPSASPSPSPSPLAERPSSSGHVPADADDDWTELLRSSSKPIASSSATAATAAATARSDGGAKKAAIPFLPCQKGIRRGQATAVASERRRSDVGTEGAASKSASNDDESPSSGVSLLRRSSSSALNQEGPIGALKEDPPPKGEKSGESKAVTESDEKMRSPLSSGSESDSGSDSGSTTDSEEERQRREERRRRREQLMAERMAAVAAEAIKEREETVARLEGEKHSLEKMLEEREKEQAQEASELQTSMIETMEAVEIEKQKHNSTRMEAFARVARLEAVNADLAKSLAAAQWNLEVEVNRMAELREQIELKELAHEEHKRRMSNIRSSATSQNEIESLRRFKLEQEFLDAEYSITCDKIMKLKDKVKRMEEDIAITRREMMHPTEVETEVKKRLDQLTDRLIQKQMQVEALSSEKATMLLRIEYPDYLVKMAYVWKLLIHLPR